MADNQALAFLGTAVITELQFYPEAEVISARFSDGSRVDLELGFMVPRGYFNRHAGAETGTG